MGRPSGGSRRRTSRRRWAGAERAVPGGAVHVGDGGEALHHQGALQGGGQPRRRAGPGLRRRRPGPGPAAGRPRAARRVHGLRCGPATCSTYSWNEDRGSRRARPACPGRPPCVGSPPQRTVGPSRAGTTPATVPTVADPGGHEAPAATSGSAAQVGVELAQGVRGHRGPSTARARSTSAGDDGPGGRGPPAGARAADHRCARGPEQPGQPGAEVDGGLGQVVWSLGWSSRRSRSTLAEQVDPGRGRAAAPRRAASTVDVVLGHQLDGDAHPQRGAAAARAGGGRRPGPRAGRR